MYTKIEKGPEKDQILEKTKFGLLRPNLATLIIGHKADL